MTEKERNNLIKEEFQRIFVFFEDLGENEKSLVIPLIQNCSFMRVTLEDLQEIIRKEGPVETYCNGQNQYGRKQSAALQSYNTMIKNYAAIVKNLIGLLPPAERPAISAFIPTHISEPATEEDFEEQAREARRVRLTCEYEKWVRDQEKAGIEVTVGFEEWLKDYSGEEV